MGIIKAAKENDVKLVKKFLFEAGKQNNEGKSALMHAAKNGNLELVKLLATKEAGLRDKNGNTALMYAVKNGYIRCAEFLVPHESCKQNNEGKTALMLFMINGNIRFDEEENRKIHNRSAREKKNAFIRKTKEVDLFVEFLVSYEAGLCDNDGKTALMHGAENPRGEHLHLLIPHEKGKQDKDGNTALILGTIAYNRTDKDDYTPSGCFRCPAIYIGLGVLAPHELNIKNNDNKSAFDYIIKKECYDILKEEFDEEYYNKKVEQIIAEYTKFIKRVDNIEELFKD